MAALDEIAAVISHATGEPLLPSALHNAGGGCINQAFILASGARRYFIKTNRAAVAWMFEAEAEGLDEILKSRSLRAPRPVCHGTAGDTAYLVLEYLDLGGHGDPAEMGRQLAAMHRCTTGQFGWKRNNTIGSTPQSNPWTQDWVEFLGKHRLGFQLELAAKNGLGNKLQKPGEALLAHLEVFFQDYQPAPSLLHGDLWGGNAAFTRSGEPVIFDPAVYYGDREADLAMTELFGGFDASFYSAYREAWPLDAGYSTRKTLYNLYHILNHANLFGGGYVNQADVMIRRLLAEIR